MPLSLSEVALSSSPNSSYRIERTIISQPADTTVRSNNGSSHNTTTNSVTYHHTATTSDEENDDLPLIKKNTTTKTFDSSDNYTPQNTVFEETTTTVVDNYPHGTEMTLTSTRNTATVPSASVHDENEKTKSSSSCCTSRRRTWWIMAVFVLIVIVVAAGVLVPTVFLKSTSTTQTTSSSKLSDNLNTEPKPTATTSNNTNTSTTTASTPTATSSSSSSSTNTGSKPQPTKQHTVPAPAPKPAVVVETTDTPTTNTRTPLEDTVWTVLTSQLPDPTSLYDAWSIERHVYEWMVTPSSSTTTASSSSNRPTFIESLLGINSKGNVTVDIDDYVTTKIYQRYSVALLDATWHTSSSSLSTKNSTDRELQQTLALRSAHKVLDECSWIGVSCTKITYSKKTKDTMEVVSKIVWNNMELQGTIPEALTNLPYLTYLDVTGNKITGSLPDFIYENMTDLTHLVFHDNQLTGSISSKIGALTQLEKLYLSCNQMTGSIPTELGDDPTVQNSSRPLKHLVLYNNSFTGPLPSPFNLKLLSYLDLGFNQLTGTIPEDWIVGTTSLSKLRSLYLDHNQLTGTMPGTFPRLGNGKMEDIHLQNNNLSGDYSFDQKYASKTFMNILEIQHNNFTGGVAKAICALSVLDGGELIELGADCSICDCKTFCDICYD